MARFIGHYNVLTRGEAARVFGIEPPNAKVVAIRPEVIDLGEASDGELSFRARVTGSAMLGYPALPDRGLRHPYDDGGVNHDAPAMQPGEEAVLSVARRSILEIAR